MSSKCNKCGRDFDSKRETGKYGKNLHFFLVHNKNIEEIFNKINEL